VFHSKGAVNGKLAAIFSKAASIQRQPAFLVKFGFLHRCHSVKTPHFRRLPANTNVLLKEKYEANQV
jgi:hypothetical protein